MIEKTCPQCGKTFFTEYPSKVYCNKTCAKLASYEHDESYYDFPHMPDAEPLYSFECACCGKTVHVYSKYDQRSRFCCGICAKAFQSGYQAMQRAKRRGSNIGMSGGMSLGSLIKREARSVDKEDVIEVRICPICGKHFDVSKGRSNQKFCSLECRRTERNRKQRCRYAANRN